jgi:ribosomal protein S18 acetylase RimI-like enzyme
MNLPPPRPYRDERDLDAMRAVLSAGRLADNGTAYIHPGDLNWWWYYHDPQGALPGSTFLWEADGQTLGWVMAEGGNVDVFFRPELRGTPEAAAMVDWGIRRMAEASAPDDLAIRFNSVRENDRFLIDHLEDRGFAPQERCLVHHSLPLERLPRTEAPAGYTVRGMAGEHEAASRARASRAAFQTKKPWEAYLENYVKFTHSPVYDRELDVVAVDREGEIGAFAICWMDPVSKIGLFEPVGTHPDHQRRGLGRSVLLEGMRRMAERGMRTAEVSTYSDNPAALGLYRSLGFRIDANLLTYGKPITAPSTDSTAPD